MTPVALAAAALLWAAPQPGLPATGDRLDGFTLPVVPLAAPIHLDALRAHTWTAGATHRLYLDGDVRIAVGSRSYRARSAVVWLHRTADAQGTVNQFAVYFQRLADGARRSGPNVAATDLLLTARTRGAVTLDVAFRRQGRPADADPLAAVTGGEQRLAAHLGRLQQEPRFPARTPLLEPTGPPPPPPPAPGLPVAPHEPPEPAVVPPVDAPAEPAPLFGPQGTLHFSFPGEVSIIGDPEEDVALATGTLAVEYTALDRAARWHHLTLTAQRAVIFADPGRLEDVLAGPVEAESVRGIYLEGNVIATADNGRYTVRAPHMYYDLRSNQAIMVDAVLRTYARFTRLPIYARAKEMRQLSADQWEARDANVSTSEFFEPHLALGSQRVTVTQRPGAEGDEQDRETHFDSVHNTLELGGVPIMYWPRFSGTAEDVPIRSVTVGTRDNDGVRILTEWDPFVLLGTERPEGVDATLKADGFTDRGAAVGLELRYDRGAVRGEVDLYGLYDEGTDRTSSGFDVEPDDTFRGLALWEHDWRFDDWRIQAQLSWISDETFVTSWRDRDFAERREYVTGLSAVHRRDNAFFSAVARYDLNDFISNSWLLASRGYQVDKLPEVTLGRYGDSLFDDRVTYSGHLQVSRVRMRFEESTPEELGVRPGAFGIAKDVPVGDALSAAGLPTKQVARFDTRHEISVPMQAGPVKAVPFAVARLTAWNEDISFSSDDDQARLFGAIGIRLGTQLVRVNNDVESRLLGLHRLRHILEPRMVAWFGHANISQEDLPVFDESVESTGTGAVLEVGVRNTFQTQRGGPGRWYSVDVLTVDTAVVVDSNDTDRESPASQFFEWRPEYSQFGDHARGAATWLLSDHVSVAGEATYDLEDNLLARGSIGTELRHTPRLSTMVEYRYLEASSNELLEVAWSYMLTPKYTVSLRPQWDFRANDFRAVSVRVVRRFPDFDLTIQVTRDEIADDTSVGASIGVVDF